MLSNITKELVDDTSGATAIEYGLVVALIAMAMLVALQSVAGTTVGMWNNVNTKSTAAMTGA